MSTTPADLTVSKTVATAAPQAVRPAPVRPARGAPKRLRWPIVAAVVVVLLLSAVGYLLVRRNLNRAPDKDIQLFSVAPRSFPVILDEKGELKAAELIEIRSQLEGRATIITLVPEGTHAKKGDLLLELACDAIDDSIREEQIKEANAQAAYEAAVKEEEILKDKNASDIRKADVALQMAEMALEKYREGEAVELRQEATLSLEKARSVLKRAEEDLKDANDLFSQGFVTRIELEDYRFKAYAASLDLKNADLALKVLEKYTIPMALQQKQSDVDEAKQDLDRTRKSAAAAESKARADVVGKQSQLSVLQEKLAKLRDQKAKAKIVAPADGLVVYARGDHWWRSENNIEKGATVYERQSLIELPDTSKMKVVIRVHEAQTEHLQVGLPAVVEIEGMTGQQFPGKVSQIAVLADSQNRFLNPNLKEYSTEILLDATFKGELKPGLTAHVKVEIARLNNVLAVPVQAVFGKGGKYFVFVDDSGAIRHQEVKIGLSSNEYVEIKEGLKTGQVVRMAISDEMKAKLPEVEHGDEPAKPVRRPAALSQPAEANPEAGASGSENRPRPQGGRSEGSGGGGGPQRSRRSR